MNFFTAFIGLSLLSMAADAKGEIPVLVSETSIKEYLGRHIIIRGPVENSRIATIFGVDVESFNPDLRGKNAEAEGILEKEVVTEESIMKKTEETGIFAHRGPGIFYRLKEVSSNKTSHVRPLF